MIWAITVPRKPSCSGCCVRDLSCTACARCQPRYLCVDVEVLPGPYASLGCCDVDDYGIGHFSFRMTRQCGGWSGSGSCSGIFADIQVTLSGTGPSCSTVVNSTLLATPLEFAGFLPAITFVAEDSDGNEFTITISRSSVVENPVIKERCSPCTCTTCLPAKICARVTATATDYAGSANDAASLNWDCETKQWAGSVGDTSVVIQLKPASSGICGVDITATGPHGSYSGIYYFEGALNSRKIHGTICRDSDSIQSTLGAPELLPCETEPCDDPPPQDWVSLIDVHLSLLTGSTVTGTLSLRDQSCGECTPACSATCCDPAEESDCHITLSSTCSAINGASWLLTRTGSHHWSGGASIAGPSFTTIALHADMSCVGDTTGGISGRPFNAAITINACSVSLDGNGMSCVPIMSGTLDPSTVDLTSCVIGCGVSTVSAEISP